MDCFDAFNNIKTLINNNCDYKMNLSKDSLVIDYIIENNFRYFTQINLYLRDVELLIVPDCHIQLLLYTGNLKTIDKIKRIIEEFDCLEIKM